MTREQLDAIRARYADEPLLGEMRTDKFGNLITVTREHPVVALLAEVEHLREDCTGLVKQNERQYDEVVRLTAERDTTMDRMQQAIIDLLNEHNAPLHLIARIVEMEYP
jgi:hypothetical protein